MDLRRQKQYDDSVKAARLLSSPPLQFWLHSLSLACSFNHTVAFSAALSAWLSCRPRAGPAEHRPGPLRRRPCPLPPACCNARPAGASCCCWCAGWASGGVRVGAVARHARLKQAQAVVGLGLQKLLEVLEPGWKRAKVCQQGSIAREAEGAGGTAGTKAQAAGRAPGARRPQGLQTQRQRGGPAPLHLSLARQLTLYTIFNNVRLFQSQIPTCMDTTPSWSRSASRSAASTSSGNCSARRGGRRRRAGADAS